MAALITWNHYVFCVCHRHSTLFADEDDEKPFFYSYLFKGSRWRGDEEKRANRRHALWFMLPLKISRGWQKRSLIKRNQCPTKSSYPLGFALLWCRDSCRFVYIRTWKSHANAPDKSDILADEIVYNFPDKFMCSIGDKSMGHLLLETIKCQFYGLSDFFPFVRLATRLLTVFNRAVWLVRLTWHRLRSQRFVVEPLTQ